MTLAALVGSAADNTVSPGVLGFVVVGLLGVATWLLIRSMRRQIKKIDIPEEGTPTRPEENGAGSEERGGTPR